MKLKYLPKQKYLILFFGLPIAIVAICMPLLVNAFNRGTVWCFDDCSLYPGCAENKTLGCLDDQVCKRAECRNVGPCGAGTACQGITMQGCNYLPLGVTVALTANPNSGNAPLTVNLTATVAGSATGTVVYDFDWTNNGSWDNSYSNSGPSITKSYTYSSSATAAVRVTREGCVSAEDTANITIITPAATCNLSANPSTIVQGGLSTLTWSSNYAQSCSAIWTSSTATSGTKDVSPATTTTYNMTCTGSGGSGNCSATITVNLPAATCNLSANPSTIVQGGLSTLTWSSNYAQSCSAIWTSSTATSGTKDVSPATTTTYNMTCTGSGGSGNCSKKITVICGPAQSPIISLSAPLASWINYNPNFKAQVSDPNSDQVRAHFEVVGIVADGVGNWVTGSGTSCYLSDCSTGLSLVEGQYTWGAYAEDNSALVCTSAPTAYQWLGVDKTPPTGDITHSPASPTTSDQVTFTATGSDALSGMKTIKIYVDATLKNTCSLLTTCAYTGGPYSAGSHNYYAIFEDNATNTYTTSTKNFTVGSLTFSVSLTANPYYGSPSGFTSTLTATVSNSAGGNITYQFDCTNNGSYESGSIVSPNTTYSYGSCPAYTADSVARARVTQGSNSAEATANLYVTTLVVTPNPANILVGGTVQFTATYDTDGNGSGFSSQNVTGSATWTSTNTAVATVNNVAPNKGLAAGVAAGTATINASYSGFSGSATINVGSLKSNYKVKISGLNRAPRAETLQRTDPDWCGSPPFYSFTWIYQDADGDTESQFKFQILDAGTPVVEQTVAVPFYPSGTQNSSQPIKVALSPNPDIRYGKTYTWQVMVWDSLGKASAWASGGSFSTASHHYPSFANPSFTTLPAKPSAGENVKFTPQATCYDDVSTGSICHSPAYGGNDSFLWAFSGGPGTVNSDELNLESPVASFSAPSTWNVTVKVTDSTSGGAFNCTSAPKSVNVTYPLPGWKEIMPK